MAPYIDVLASQISTSVYSLLQTGLGPMLVCNDCPHSAGFIYSVLEGFSFTEISRFAYGIALHYGF